MALTKEDLQAIGELMDAKLEPINKRLDGMDARLGGMDARFDGMDKRLTSLEDTMAAVINSQKDIRESQNITRDSQLRVELEQFPRIAAALDGNKSNADKNREQDRRIAGIESVIDDHSIRIFALEQAG